jgi:hypothetical protein
VPVPIIVTEPAVDCRAGAGLLFFSEPLTDARRRRAACD